MLRLKWLWGICDEAFSIFSRLSMPTELGDQDHLLSGLGKH